MQVIKKKSELGDICLKDNDKYLTFTYDGNGDLYWTFINHEKSNNIDYSFTITKENFKVYELFVELFDDIKNINLYDFDEAISNLTLEEKNKV